MSIGKSIDIDSIQYQYSIHFWASIDIQYFFGLILILDIHYFLKPVLVLDIQYSETVLSKGLTFSLFMKYIPGSFTGSGMALVQMASVEEAIRALAKLHNKTPEGHKTRNNSGLCLSFSGRKDVKDVNWGKEREKEKEKEMSDE